MIHRCLTKLLAPLMLLWLILRHGDIWTLKRHLVTTGTDTGLRLAAYDYFFARYGGWVGVSAVIDGTPCFPHGYYGVFISGGARIGKNVVIFQQVTIGSNSLSGTERAGSPQLGDGVYVGAGAKIIGGVVIADNCRIGANAVVYEDLPSNSVAVQQPTRVIQKATMDNRYFTYRDGYRVYFDSGRWIKEGLKDPPAGA